MGKFNTYGGYFAPEGYFRINEGGSHEENPNGGVQVGVDQEGTPNMLEEGEPVYNDYVYSDNIYADGGILEKYNIPAKYAGKLYSKIADAFVDEAEDRPNDPISNNGLNAMLVRLANAQEEQKAIAQQKELEEQLANMTPEELDALEAMLAEQEAAEQQAAQEQVMQEQAMAEQQATPEEQAMAAQQMQVPVQEVPQQPMMACGGKITRKYAPGGLLINPPTRTVVTPQRDNTATVFTGTSTGLPYEEPVENRQPGLLEILGDTLDGKKSVTLSDGTESPIVGGAGVLEWFSPGNGKLLKVAGKTGKAARAFTKARVALEEAERAENKVKNLQAAGRDITVAKRKADVLADKAIDAMVKSENARNIAQGKTIANTTKKAVGSAEKAKSTWIAPEGFKSYRSAPNMIFNTAVDPSFQWRRGYNVAREAGNNKFLSGLNAFVRGVPGTAASTAFYGSMYNPDDNPKAYEQAWDTSGAFANGGIMNKYEIGGPYITLTDSPGNVNPSYYSGEVPYMNPLLRGTLYRQPDGSGVITPTRRVVNGRPGFPPMLPLDYGRRWYTYRPGDVVNWNANVSGSDKARIVDGTEYVNTLPFNYGFNDNPQVRKSNAKRIIVDPLVDLKTTHARIDMAVDPLRRPEGVASGYAPATTDYNPELNIVSREIDPTFNVEVNSKPSDTTTTKKTTERPNYPTWMRYAGLANALGDMAWNLAQKPDRYHINPYRPVLPEGRMDLIDPIFNPIDENMAVNDLLASNAGTVYGLRNSGVGPSLGANILAADYNAGRNIGAARTQIWDANNQRRNQVIAQRNQNGQILGNFNYGINRERAQILNDAKIRNMHNSLIAQRLNNAAEQEKWDAFNTSKDALASGLSNIGLENMRLNNANDLYDYVRLPDGRMAYVPKMNTAKCGGKMSKKTKK